MNADRPWCGLWLFCFRSSHFQRASIWRLAPIFQIQHQLDHTFVYCLFRVLHFSTKSMIKCHHHCFSFFERHRSLLRDGMLFLLAVSVWPNIPQPKRQTKNRLFSCLCICLFFYSCKKRDPQLSCVGNRRQPSCRLDTTARAHCWSLPVAVFEGRERRDRSRGLFFPPTASLYDGTTHRWSGDSKQTPKARHPDGAQRSPALTPGHWSARKKISKKKREKRSTSTGATQRQRPTPSEKRGARTCRPKKQEPADPFHIVDRFFFVLFCSGKKSQNTSP